MDQDVKITSSREDIAFFTGSSLTPYPRTKKSIPEFAQAARNKNQKSGRYVYFFLQLWMPKVRDHVVGWVGSCAFSLLGL